MYVMNFKKMSYACYNVLKMFFVCYECLKDLLFYVMNVLKMFFLYVMDVSKTSQNVICPKGELFVFGNKKSP